MNLEMLSKKVEGLTEDEKFLLASASGVPIVIHTDDRLSFYPRTMYPVGFFDSNSGLAVIVNKNGNNNV